MTDKAPETNKPASPDWFVRGALVRVGDIFDQFLGRKWTPSSSLATTELIERIKRLLDSEAKEVVGKGRVVPHDIRLKAQWDKFATDETDAIKKLENELLVATADHINDSLYYTFAPLTIAVEPDYFGEGVRITASFGKFSQETTASELNVTVAGIDLKGAVAEMDATATSKKSVRLIAHIQQNGKTVDKDLELSTGTSASIGRGGSNELIIDDNSVSKMHASLSIDENGDLQLADTGSTNGTFLNGERIAYAKAIKIRATDVVTLGTVKVTFEKQEDATIGDETALMDKAETVKIEGFEFTSRPSVDASEVELIKEEPEEK